MYVNNSRSSRCRVIYVAGPFRGKTPWDVEKNIRRAEELAFRVANAGAMPLCPHTMTRYFDKQCTDEFWLAGTLELLERCDAIILTANWEQSTGARGEYDRAGALNLPVLIETAVNDEELAAWIRLL